MFQGRFRWLTLFDLLRLLPGRIREARRRTSGGPLRMQARTHRRRVTLETLPHVPVLAAPRFGCVERCSARLTTSRFAAAWFRPKTELLRQLQPGSVPQSRRPQPSVDSVRTPVGLRRSIENPLIQLSRRVLHAQINPTRSDDPPVLALDRTPGYPALVRGPVVVAWVTLCLVAGCTDDETATERVYCELRLPECLEFAPDGTCRAVLTTGSDAEPVLFPHGGVRGVWQCRDTPEQSAQGVCEDACETALEQDGGAGQCRATPVLAFDGQIQTAPGCYSDDDQLPVRIPSYVTLPGPLMAPDLEVTMTGSALVQSDGKSTELPLSGRISLKTPKNCDPLRCEARLNSFELSLAGFEWLGAPVSDLAIYSTGPRTVPSTPVLTTAQQMLTLSSSTIAFAAVRFEGQSGVYDTLLEGEGVSIIVYTPGTGELTWDIVFRDTLDETELTLTLRAESESVLNLAPVVQADWELVEPPTPANDCLAVVALTGDATDPDGDPIYLAWVMGAGLVAYEPDIELNLPPGTHAIQLRAYDPGGALGLTQVSVEVPSSPDCNEGPAQE